MTDPFFETIEDGEWNACVGVQGTAFAYVDGYLEAARILAATVIDDELMGSRDSLIMPILYNARHGLELALKYTIERLKRLELIQAREGPVDHDILAYWGRLRDADVIDLQTRTAIAALEPYVASLARIDSDGQQLRYFETKEGVRSLDGIAVVNLPLVRESVGHLSEILETLTDRVMLLEDEHPTGTRTSRCSRTDLGEIARMMGPHVTWREADFPDRKATVMKRFGLTAKAFSNAINAIRRSRQLAGGIGIEKPLTHVSDEKMIALAERWLVAHAPPAEDFELRVINASSISFEEIDDWANGINEVVAFVEATMDLKEFADVQTVFYIGRDGVHGEHYDRLLQATIEEHRLAQRHAEKIRHIVVKTSMVDSLVSGLRRVGRPSLATNMVKLREAARPAPGRTSPRSVRRGER
jgi:hypothetical protein